MRPAGQVRLRLTGAHVARGPQKHKNDRHYWLKHDEFRNNESDSVADRYQIAAVICRASGSGSASTTHLEVVTGPTPRNSSINRSRSPSIPTLSISQTAFDHRRQDQFIAFRINSILNHFFFCNCKIHSLFIYLFIKKLKLTNSSINNEFKKLINSKNNHWTELQFNHHFFCNCKIHSFVIYLFIKKLN